MRYTREQIEKLEEAVTPLETVEWLLDHGFPIEVKGLGKKYVDIKCPNPEHNDQSFGSCKISTGKYDSRPGSTCYCYACGKRMRSLDILKQFLSFSDSLQVLAEISNNPNILTTKKFKKIATIPERTRKILDLPYQARYLQVPKSYTDVPPENTYYENEGDHYVVMQKIAWNPWDDLDAEAKSFLLREKAKERMSTISQLCTDFFHPEKLGQEVGEFLKSLDPEGFIKTLESMFQDCQKIYRSNGGKITDLKKVQKNVEQNFWEELKIS